MKEPDKNARRRGDVLIDNIYDAAVKIIREVGYPNLTFRQIAQNAKTSRTVLYRRWATTFDLIREIMVYKSALALDGELIDKIEDTGSLRSDLLQLLVLYQRFYTGVGTEIMNVILFEMSQSSEKVTDIKTGKIEKKTADIKTGKIEKKTADIKIGEMEKNILVMKKLLRLAKARGDKLKEVDDMTLVLPFDLIRMENIFRQVVDSKRLELLVDEILLPVFKL